MAQYRTKCLAGCCDSNMSICVSLHPTIHMMNINLRFIIYFLELGILYVLYFVTGKRAWKSYDAATAAGATLACHHHHCCCLPSDLLRWGRGAVLFKGIFSHYTWAFIVVVVVEEGAGVVGRRWCSTLTLSWKCVQNLWLDMKKCWKLYIQLFTKVAP